MTESERHLVSFTERLTLRSEDEQLIINHYRHKESLADVASRLLAQDAARIRALQKEQS